MTIKLEKYKGWDKDANKAVYEQLTLGIGTTVETFTCCERVMSDVWEDVRYAVYFGDDSKFHTVCIGCYGVQGNTVELDAPGLIKAYYETWKEGEKAGVFLRNEMAQEDRRFATYEANLSEVTRDKMVRVARGRKVPIGTVGRVFWTGTDGYGKAKVGIALDDTKDARGRYANIVWIAAANCDVIRGSRLDEIHAYQGR